MTKGQLKSIMNVLESLNISDSAEVKVEVVGGGRMGLLPYPIKFEGQDAEYAPDAQGNWAPNVSQANCIILKQD